MPIHDPNVSKRRAVRTGGRFSPRGSSSFLVLCIVGGLELAAAGCSWFAPSEEEVRAEFQAYVNEANACQDVRECAIVFPGCPLGCFVAVTKGREAEVENKARALIDEYQSGRRVCAYGCAAPGTLACTAGRCALGTTPPAP